MNVDKSSIFKVANAIRRSQNGLTIGEALRMAWKAAKLQVKLAAIDPQKAKAPNTVFEMVFHPNGNLNGSWIEDEDVLLPYVGDGCISYSNRIK